MSGSVYAQEFIDGLLKAIGAPVDAVTEAGLRAWLANEQSGPNLTSFDANRGNPLGIQTPQAQQSGHSGDVATAITLTAQLLKSNYSGIVDAFRAGKSVSDIAAQIVASPWNANRYGGLANFTAVAGGTAAPSQSAAVNQAASGPQPLGRTSIGSAAPPAGDPFKVAKPGETFLPSNFQGAMGETYTGPGAYKGYDLQAIPPDLRQQARNAIDYFAANPGAEQQMLQSIYQTYGNMAWAASDPQIRTILVAGTYNNWQADKGLTQSVLADTKLYKTHDNSQRNWMQIQADDPAEAAAAIKQVSASVIDVATKMGVPLSAAQVQKIAETVAPSSISVAGQYVNTTESAQQIYQMVNAQFNANQFSTQIGGGQTATGSPQGINQTGTIPGTSIGAIGGASPMPGGTAAYLYNAFQNISKNYYMDLTPQQITNYVQQYLKEDAGPGFDPTTATSGFTSLMQTQARAKYPVLGNIIGTTDSTGLDLTPYAATSWVRDMIAQYTGLGSGQDVNLSDPQWSWILSGTGSPSNRAAGLMSPGSSGTNNAVGGGSSLALPSADQLQSYLMGTPQFQTTHQAKAMAWNVGDQILKSFGFSG